MMRERQAEKLEPKQLCAVCERVIRCIYQKPSPNAHTFLAPFIAIAKKGKAEP